jgi:oligosaccharide repeat unit polymerase
MHTFREARATVRSGVGQTTISTADAVFILGSFVLCILVPGQLGGWHFRAPPGTSGSVALQLVVIVWAGARLAKLWARGEPRPFLIVFWLYVYVWLGLAGLLQIIHHASAWPISIGAAATERGQIIILLGIASVEWGHLFKWHSRPSSTRGRRIVGGRVAALVGFAIVTAPIWFIQLGGFHTLYGSREALHEALNGSGPGNGAHLASGSITIALATVTTFLALYATIVTWRHKLWRTRSRLVFVLIVIVTAVLDSPIAMPRFWVATMLLALVFAIPRVQRGGASIRVLVPVLILICLVAFPYLAYFRRTSGFKAPPSIVQSLTTTGDYDSFEMITAGVQYTAEMGNRNGRQALSDALFFVPRAGWSGKAPDTGALIGRHYNLPFINLSAPLWVEIYIDFGYVGVALVFTLYGTIMRTADDIFVKDKSAFAQFVVPLLAGYSCILLRGSLLQAMARLAVMVLVMQLISRRGLTELSDPSLVFTDKSYSLRASQGATSK